MTATITATNVVHNLFFIHEGNTEEFVAEYAADKRESATSRGRKAVRQLDAIAYRVDTVDLDAQPEVIDDEHLAGEAPEFIDMTITTHLDMADEMTGTASWADDAPEDTKPAPAPKFKRKVRVFLGKDVETKPFTYDFNGESIEVRVLTVTRTDTAIEQLGHADKISIFGHRRGILETIALHDAPEEATAAYTALGLY